MRKQASDPTSFLRRFSERQIRAAERQEAAQRRAAARPLRAVGTGRTVDPDGYVLTRAPRHPHCNSGGYVREHRLAMERHLGRYLRPEEIVHHLDGNRANNDPSNLQLYESNSAHKRDQLRGNSHARGDIGNPKRSARTMRSPDEILAALRLLADSLDRPIRRTDLQPPWPSHKAIGRAFSSWQAGVALALADGNAPSAAARDCRTTAA